MKKALLFMVVSCLSLGTMTAQIEDGSVLTENIILTDLDGNEYDIYSILDEGKTVVFDMYAEWCGPCWNYHNADSGHPAGGALKDLHNTYGPDGTDEVVVFGIESDASTPVSAIDGGAGSTYGWNWLDGVPYPMANDDDVAGIFQQGYYPYIIRICPNRQIFELGQQNAEGIMADVANCVSGSGVVNPAVLAYNGQTATCGDVEVAVTVQNLGSDLMTSATLEVTNASGSLLTYDWTGSLETYQMEEVSVGTVTISEAGDLTVTVISTDEDPSNGTITEYIEFAVESTDVINISILTDEYPEETYWVIADGDGNVVAEVELGAYAGQANEQIDEQVIVPALGCYSFTIFDSYGDGLNGAAWGGVDGNYSATSSDGTVLAEGGGDVQFSQEDSPFNATSSAVGIEDVLAGSSFDLYPNPSATGNVNVSLDLLSSQKVTIDVYDMVGKVVYNKDLGTLPAGQTVNELNVANLNSGIYMMNVTIGTESVVTKFVLKN